MLRFIAENSYIVMILICIFFGLYAFGGEDLIFFRKKHYESDPNSQENLMDALNRFNRGRDFTVLGKTTVEFNGETHTFDAILLSYYGAVLFSAQPQAGEIYADLNDEQWVAIWQKKRTVFDSPVTAMNSSLKAVKDIFRAEKVKAGQSDVMAVFTNKDAIVAVAKALPACHEKKLGEKLAASKYLADNGANIEAMKAAIEKYKK